MQHKGETMKKTVTSVLLLGLMALTAEETSGIPIKQEMLLGKTFYHVEKNANNTTIYRKFVFKNEHNDLKVGMHFMVLKPNGAVAKEGRPKLSGTLSKTGKLKIDITPVLPKGKTGYFYFTLDKKDDHAWHLTKEVDMKQDGTIDSVFHPVWHTSRPEKAPESL